MAWKHRFTPEINSRFCLAVIVNRQLKATEPVWEPSGSEKEGLVCQPARFLCWSFLRCEDACMPATSSAGITHRLERRHFKSDYPDITPVLRHLHLYKMIFNFCWFWWEIIFTHKVWKPCPFNLDFWQCRSKSKFGDHISKLGLRKNSFPVKIKECRERTQTTVRFPLIVRHIWILDDGQNLFKKYSLKIIQKYTWYLGLCECID